MGDRDLSLNGMNKNVTIAIIILILIVGGVIIYKTSKTTEDSGQTPTKTDTTDLMTPGLPSENIQKPVSSTNQGSTKEFIVLGKSYSFNPNAMTVKKGDRVKITFKDEDGFHDLKIDGYNVATARVNTGGESSVEFVADKVGSFEYYCTVGNHREKGMKGTFVVTE